MIAGEYQIRSKQDWERGLRGREIEGKWSCRAVVLIATRRAADGIDTAADCAVYSEGRSEFRASVMDPL